jgi:hypothetical protein
MSDEETRAQYYQAHKDDPEDWGEPERPPASAKRRLASMISVRFSPDEADMVRRAAEDADESLSQFVRKATLQRCQRHRYGTPTMTGTTTRDNTIFELGLFFATLTNAGPDASSGNNWTPTVVPSSSTTDIPAAA